MMLNNFHKVSNSLYRSAQPDHDGFIILEQHFRVRTIINLRSFHTDYFKLFGLHFQYHHIWMQAWHAEMEDIVKFLLIVSDVSNHPVLVHCLHGSDRTGTMIAMYRIVMEGWSKERAIEEMTHGGFGFHGIFQNLVHWIQSVDVDVLKQSLIRV